MEQPDGVLETFIKWEFSLRCHRATAETRPHSTVIYFLQHSVKELVL